MDFFQRQAFELVTSSKIRTALNVSRESPAGQTRYSGIETLLKARRLVEAGVGCVSVALSEWDTHENNFPRMKEGLPLLDLALSTIVEDLYERGMEKDVVVLAWGEFGRTPRINEKAGRDHWTPVMSAHLPSGGWLAGDVICATTPQGDQPDYGRCSIQQVLGTVCQGLQIDPR